ncbi:MAG: hypothetical protein WD275_03530 [Rhodothermales bacterium]
MLSRTARLRQFSIVVVISAGPLYVNQLFPRSFSLSAVLLAALFLTACEDPSNVGLGLVDDEGGNPLVYRVTPSDLREQELGRTLSSSRRILIGQVDDPLLGLIEVDAYVDYASSSSSDFRSGTIQTAELRFLPDYVYGDTTSIVRAAVRQIQSAWSSVGLPADTSFSVGPVLTEFTYDPSDTLIVVPLPQDWIATNDVLLRSTSFALDFHGFQIEPIEGNAVVGFGYGSSTLRVRTAADSASFASSIVYLAGRRQGDPVLPQNRILLQASAGPAAAFSFTIDAEDLPPSAINRAVIAFTADTLSLTQNLPASFVRPQITALDLYGINPDGGIAFLARSELRNGRFIFDSPFLAGVVQDIQFGERTFVRYELRVPAPISVTDSSSPLRLLSSSVNAVLLFDSDAGAEAPDASITITPLDE